MSNNSTVLQPKKDASKEMLPMSTCMRTAKLIEEAIILSALSRGSCTKTIEEVNPVAEMSTGTGIALGYLLGNNETSPTCCDWDGNMYGWKSFIMELLVLLGKPGVLDQLSEYERSEASLKVKKLYAFIEGIYEDKNTKHWLDWAAITQFGSNKKEDEKNNEYYDFTKRKDYNSFFSDYNDKEIENMQKKFPEIRERR